MSTTVFMLIRFFAQMPLVSVMSSSSLRSLVCCPDGEGMLLHCSLSSCCSQQLFPVLTPGRCKGYPLTPFGREVT